MKERVLSVKEDNGKVYTNFNGIVKEAEPTDEKGEYYVEYSVGVLRGVKVIWGMFIFPNSPRKCWAQLINERQDGTSISYDKVRGMKFSL